MLKLFLCLVIGALFTWATYWYFTGGTTAQTALIVFGVAILLTVIVFRRDSGIRLSKPGLLDAVADHQNMCGIGGKWYIAKPVPYYAWWMVFERVWHAWLVFRGKAIAVQYATDRK